MTTFAPSRANASAVAWPIPESAPVTIATLPSSFPIQLRHPGRKRIPVALCCHDCILRAGGGVSMKDEIRKQTVLRAPVERVWQSVTDAGKFGEWFGVKFDGPFEAGRRVTGHIVPTRVDKEVAKMQEPYTGMPFEFVVGSVEP